MKLLFKLFLLAAVLLAARADSEPLVATPPGNGLIKGGGGTDGGVGSVFGGSPAGEAEPNMASLRKSSGVHSCGGTLIHSRVVLTAAHCIEDVKRSIDVDIGRLRRVGSDGSRFLSYKSIDTLIHENYNPETFDYDIALLILNEACPFPPLPLATSEYCFENQGDCKVKLLGWGNTEKGYFSSVLQEATTSSVTRRICRTLLGTSTVTDRMICAGEVIDGGIDACQGDSGGPLILDNRQVGIVSFGIECGLSKSPGVYTSVPKMRSWIKDKLSQFSFVLPSPLDGI